MGERPFFHAHAHSEYSVLDGMPKVEDMVRRAVRMRQPALALTDHGNMSGAIELYKHCKAAGIKPFIGEEFYVVKDVKDKEAKRYHLCILALSEEGYGHLADLTTRSHERDNYHYRPRIDLSMLADISAKGGKDHLAILTGCYFSNLVQMLTWAPDGKLMDKGKRKELARVILGTMTKWFPHTFIEIQHHNTKHPNQLDDQTIMELLWQMSGDGFMHDVIVTQDSHYLRHSDQDVHDLMKAMAYRGSDDASFPGDGYHLATAQWMRSHYVHGSGPQVWDASLESMTKLLDLNTLRLPAIDQYSYYVPHRGKDKWLRNTCYKALHRYNGPRDNWGLAQPEGYKRRLEHELDVIKDVGMAGYFYLIHRGVKYAREEGIYINARGSANGSLVCFLLGITNVDPIQWKLLFERFLSRDRTKPPDIDLDIEHSRREDVVNFFARHYPLVQLGTYMTLGENEWGRGSVLVQFLGWKRRALSPERFKAAYGHVKYIDDLDDEQAEMLHRLAQYRVRKSAGAHAAGFVVGTKQQPIEKYLPTMLIPSADRQVTQFTMDSVESLGYVKIDLLGQRTLTTIKRCLYHLDRDYDDGLAWIPMDDKATLRELRRGRSETGVFQFEGWAAAKGCRQLGVRSTNDCIKVMALYRPATMNSGYVDMYLDNRRDKTLGNLPDHPSFKKHLRETWGLAIYQEQVMSILRDLGMPEDRLNQFLSALKMSNDKAVRAQEIFRKQRDFFIELAQENGMSRDDAIAAWDFLSGFGGYGFNRAHATAYGVLGYQAQYLKTHYPLEYMAAVLETTAGTPKEKVYLKEAREMGLTIKAPDVNLSSVTWRIEGEAIRKGLTSIKGVGSRAAADITMNAPYTDVQDLIDRTKARLVTGGKDWTKKSELKGVMKALQDGGALRSLGINPY